MTSCLQVVALDEALHARLVTMSTDNGNVLLLASTWWYMPFHFPEEGFHVYIGVYIYLFSTPSPGAPPDVPRRA